VRLSHWQSRHSHQSNTTGYHTFLVYKRWSISTENQCIRLNAFEFGPHNFAIGRVSTPLNFPPIGFTTPGGLTLRLFLHCVLKNIPSIFNYNLKTNYQTLTIFGTNIPDKTCHRMTVWFQTSPNVCFCTTWGKHNQRNITFYPMRYDCLIYITRKNPFCSYFWHFGWHFIQLSAVKLLEVFAHCANTGKERLSPFTDSSIDKVLFQTNPGCTSRFLTLQTFLNFIW